MILNNKPVLILVSIFFLIFIVLSLYTIKNYNYIGDRSTSVELTFNTEVGSHGVPIMYVKGKSDSKINYGRVYNFKSQDRKTFSAKLDDTLKLRGFKLYFEYPNQRVTIKSFDIIANSQRYPINLAEECDLVNIDIEQGDYKGWTFDVLKTNGNIEFTKRFLYPSDFNSIYKLLIPISILAILITFIINNFNYHFDRFKIVNLSDVSLALIIITIFLPAPIYNIALIVGLVLNLNKLKIKNVLKNKLNLIVLAFFTIYLLNNLFLVSGGYNSMSTIERFLPFFILTILIPNIANRRYLALFPLSAIGIGFYLLVTSILDAFIHDSITFLSFENFAKYLHPVYYSYLLFFSILYIQYNYFGKDKYVLQLLLFMFLIFSGSKMVLFTVLIVFCAIFLKSRKGLLYLLPILVVVFLFSPLKSRFVEILNLEDISILNEKYIEVEDSRINGLTFRLIIWREALSTMNGIDYIFGEGVTKYTEKILEEELIDVGMIQYKDYNPHNQYIDTFWRTGVVGLLFLILIPLYSLKIGVNKKDNLIVCFSLFMIAIMFSESIFGRVNGIYFFTTILLILLNTIEFNEHKRQL